MRYGDHGGQDALAVRALDVERELVAPDLGDGVRLAVDAAVRDRLVAGGLVERADLHRSRSRARRPSFSGLSTPIACAVSTTSGRPTSRTNRAKTRFTESAVAV